MPQKHRGLCRTGFVALTAASIMACGASAVPTSKLSSSRASVRAAEEVGARQTPQAALHLKLAQDQIERARRLMREGKNDAAALTLDQAQADAEIAIALAHEARARREAQEAKDRVAQLRQQGQIQ